MHGWTERFPSAVVVLFVDGGRRCVAFSPDSCHTLRHVSGVRFVWFGWIPALGSDIRLCIPLQSWSESNFSLGQASGFLCSVPNSEGIRLSHRPSFVSCCPSGCITRRTPKLSPRPMERLLFLWSAESRLSSRMQNASRVSGLTASFAQTSVRR